MDGNTPRIETEAQHKMPPYVSYATFKTFIADMQQHGLPARIDRSALPKMSGSVLGQLMAALRFLDLISGKPTDRLGGLVAKHGTDQWGLLLQDLLRSAYPEVFEVDLATATPSLFAEAFKKYGSTENVIRKCRTFFVAAAQDAGLPISPRILAGKKTRVVAASRRRITKPAATIEPSATTLPPNPLLALLRRPRLSNFSRCTTQRICRQRSKPLYGC